MTTSVQEILETLFNDSGMLTPERVLRFAEPEDSPLHTHFEWDDTEAAHKYRVEQARTLIRGVTITHARAPDMRIRAYVSLPTDRAAGAGYRRMADVLSSDFLRHQLTSEMLAQARAWEERARMLGYAFDSKSIVRQAKKIGGGKR